MPRIFQDLRYAVRGLIRTPLFSLGIVITLALGIGINATMFGVVDTLFLRPPAGVTDPASIVRIGYRQTSSSGGNYTQTGTSFPTFLDLHDHVPQFAAVAAVRTGTMSLGRGGEAREVNFAAVSADYFPLMGVRASVGRFFTSVEDRVGGDRVAVLSYHFWQSRFNGDPAVIGKALPLGKGTYTVIGIGPEKFSGIDLTATDIFLPIRPAAEGDVVDAEAISSRNYYWLDVIARLKPGVSPVAAASRATLAYRAGASSDKEKDSTTVTVFGPVQEARGTGAGSDAKVALWIGILSAVVLLIACANVANLLLARGVSRGRELAVRASLGAGRGGLMRVLLSESVVLAIAGGGAALIMALWGGGIARAFLLPDLSPDTPILEPRMLAFGAFAVLFTAVLIGLIPAVQASRADLVGALKQGGRGSTASGSRMRMVLLLTQIALTLMLLVGAGLFVRSLRKVQGIDLGFDADRVYTVNMDLSAVGLSTEDANAIYLRLVDRYKQINGVENAAASMGSPFRSSYAMGIRAEGVDSIPRVKGGGPYYQAITAGYFATMGGHILTGRDFNEGDRAGAPPVAIVGATFASKVWPGQSAIGKCLYTGGDTSHVCTRVVGVVSNAKRGQVIEKLAMIYYLSYPQMSKPTISGIFVRQRVGAHGIAGALQRDVLAMGNLPFARIHTMAETILPQLRSWQLGASAFTAFGLLALVIAAIGIFAVLSYGVSQRTREIGVRVALGAQSGQVVRMIVAQGLKAALLGTAIGAVGALLLGRAIASLLYQVAPTDPAVFGIVVGVLLTVAALAASLPALRAAGVAPLGGLRSE